MSEYKTDKKTDANPSKSLTVQLRSTCSTFRVSWVTAADWENPARCVFTQHTVGLPVSSMTLNEAFGLQDTSRLLFGHNPQLAALNMAPGVGGIPPGRVSLPRHALTCNAASSCCLLCHWPRDRWGVKAVMPLWGSSLRSVQAGKAACKADCRAIKPEATGSAAQ